MKIFSQLLIILIISELSFTHYQCKTSEQLKKEMQEIVETSFLQWYLFASSLESIDKRFPAIIHLDEKFTVYKYVNISDEKRQMIQKSIDFLADTKDNDNLSVLPFFDCVENKNGIYIIFDGIFKDDMHIVEYSTYSYHLKSERREMYIRYLNTIDLFQKTGLTTRNVLHNKQNSLEDRIYLDPFYLADNLPITGFKDLDYFYSPEIFEDEFSIDEKSMFLWNTLYILIFEISVLHRSQFPESDILAKFPTQEFASNFIDKLIAKYQDYYEPQEPGIFVRFPNWIKSFFLENVSTVYDFPTLIKQLYPKNFEKRKSSETVLGIQKQT